ncbi:MAG: FAD-dependent thymidylate synthase [Acidobacteria bacterium]|nr:FAD-dependent thymidylate synthase [Acidobacteriota bacterium]
MSQTRSQTTSTLMDLQAPIKIHIVGRPTFDIEEFVQFLANANLAWRRSAGVGEAQELIEVAGRVCYMSFGTSQSDRSNCEYIHNLIQMGHESVLEHVNWSFVITGISRSLSHQIVRHRVGFAFSQLSQQYHDETDAKFRMPAEIEENPRAAEAWERSIATAKAAYGEILQALDRASAASTGGQHARRELRRSVRTAARSVLPSCTETTLFMTANARALRHFFSVRGGIPGDREMRDFAVALLRAVAQEAPALFFDFKIAELPDGSEIVKRQELGQP